MRRRNDTRPATAKLSAFADKLGELKKQLNGSTKKGDAPQQQSRPAPPKPKTSAVPVKLSAAAHARLKADEAHYRAKADAGIVAEPIVPKIDKRPTRPPCPIELRRRAALRVREVVRGSSPELETRPSEVSESTAALIKVAIEAGAEIVAGRPNPDLDNGFIVGFDMGTSSLKVAVRQPYRSNDPVAALTAPQELRSGEHPCLWQAVIWYHPETERFTLVPEPGAIALGGFKTGIVGGLGNSWVRADVRVTRAEAAVAFTCMQIAYLLGRYAQQRPLGSTAGDHFLSINVGIPVSACDQSETYNAFTRVIASAYELAPYAADLNLKDVRTVHGNCRPALPPGFELVPELTAAISGYAAMPTAPPGAHILVDVGASTLDIVAFNLIERSRVSVFTAGVDLFGAGALKVAKAAGIQDQDFKRACDHHFELVYGGARSDRRAPTLFHPQFRRNPVQLLTTGGGCATELHARFIEEMPRVLGNVPMMRPLPPGGITAEACDLSRLLLAYGLTRDLPELLEARLPSQIEDLTLQAAAVPMMISKDQV